MDRMRLTVEDSGHVELAYTDAYTDERVTRRFSAPGYAVGYVLEHKGGTTTQPCAALASHGATLMASRDTLADVIRREYRAMRRAERTERDRAKRY